MSSLVYLSCREPGIHLYMSKIAVIIVSWNNQKDTLECLESLDKADRESLDLEIILVDNASSDGTVLSVEKRFPRIKIIKNLQNLGFAKANNQGMELALKNNADYILLLNNDTLVSQKFLPPLLSAMERDQKTALASPKIYFAPGFEYHYEKYRAEEKGKVFWYAGGLIDWKNIICSHRGVDEVDHAQYDEMAETGFGTGCCLMLKSAMLKEVGVFDERYFMYFEDVDLNVRARKKGWKIKYVPESFIWHKNATSSGKPGSSLHNYYLTRNRLLFGLKFATLKTKLALLRNAFYLYKRNLPGERRGVIDFLCCRFGKKRV